METDTSLADAISEAVHITKHDSRWAAQFVVERERLLGLLPDRFAAVEHIGSTAVPRLAAKPIIDILAGVGSMSEADALLEPLCAHGYVTSAEFNATLPDRRWLMRHAFGRRTHHLHLVAFGGPQWILHLQFRDLLRSDAAVATRYERLKHELAERHRDDREAYTDAKAAFINEVFTSVAGPTCATARATSPPSPASSSKARRSARRRPATPSPSSPSRSFLPRSAPAASPSPPGRIVPPTSSAPPRPAPAPSASPPISCSGS